jgi:hypothetical protein
MVKKNEEVPRATESASPPDGGGVCEVRKFSVVVAHETCCKAFKGSERVFGRAIQPGGEGCGEAHKEEIVKLERFERGYVLEADASTNYAHSFIRKDHLDKLEQKDFDNITGSKWTIREFYVVNLAVESTINSYVAVSFSENWEILRKGFGIG